MGNIMLRFTLCLAFAGFLACTAATALHTATASINGHIAAINAR